LHERMISIRVHPWVLSGSAVLLLACLLGAGGVHPADSIDNYALPAKTAFPAAMPRYPNAWFYIDASLAPSFEAAVRLVTGGLRQAMHLPEYYPPFDNPEGCDFEVRVEQSARRGRAGESGLPESRLLPFRRKRAL
jgi:hypothetical protein